MREETPIDSRPHFVIPYWPSPGPGVDGDTGNLRPLPSNVCWYLNPSIEASPYTPGERLDVRVTVANYGGANTESIAQVTVWWSKPNSGFVVGPDTLIGYDSVPVQGRGGFGQTKTLSKVIPASAPNHICLLARVSHQYDRAGVTVDPNGDRHWAQRNIETVVVTPGTPAAFEFFAGNPFMEEAEFLVTAHFASEERHRALSELLQGEVDFAEAELSLGDGSGTEAQTRLTLRPGQQEQLQLVVTLNSRVPHGHFVPFEIEQRLGDEGPIVGGIGIIVSTD